MGDLFQQRVTHYEASSDPCRLTFLIFFPSSLIELLANDALDASPYAVHRHPPGQAIPQGLPGALSPDVPSPTKPIPVDQLNNMYMQRNQDVNNR